MLKEDVFALIDELQAKGVPATVVVNLYVTESSPAPTTGKFTIMTTKALAHFVYGENANGFPIMMIYPSESITENRVKFLKDETVNVIPTAIKADGDKRFYELVGEFKNEDGTVIDKILYINAAVGAFTL